MTKPYYAYSAGSLESVNVSAHNMRGFNQWDEDWKMGHIVAGEEVSDTTYRLISKNYIPVVPGATYCFTAPRGKGVTVYGYDGAKNYQSPLLLDSNRTYSDFDVFTVGANICYIKFQMYSSYGSSASSTYKNDICINLSSDRNGEYEPYIKHSYPLDSSLTLRGIWKLDANNKPYCDGDRYLPDGTVERRYGSVDLGTLTWAKSSSTTGGFGGSMPSETFPPYKWANNTQMICDSYIFDGVSSSTAGYYGANGTFRYNYVNSGSSTREISIHDESKASMTAEEFKTALSGTYLVYELATQTTESADPYTTPQIVDPYGTEEYVDYAESQGTRDVAIPVGHTTFYPEDLRKKIEDLPWDFSTLIAPTEKGFTASRNYTAGSFLIIGNQLYKVTSNIAQNGTITVGSNVTATTIAEELVALA